MKFSTCKFLLVLGTLPIQSQNLESKISSSSSIIKPKNLISCYACETELNAFANEHRNPICINVQPVPEGELIGNLEKRNGHGLGLMGEHENQMNFLGDHMVSVVSANGKGKASDDDDHGRKKKRKKKKKKKKKKKRKKKKKKKKRSTAKIIELPTKLINTTLPNTLPNTPKNTIFPSKTSQKLATFLKIPDPLRSVECAGLCFTEYEGQNVYRGCISSNDIKLFYNNFFASKKERDAVLARDFKTDKFLDTNIYEKFMRDIHGYRKFRLCKTDHCNDDVDLELKRAYFDPMVMRMQKQEYHMRQEELLKITMEKEKAVHNKKSEKKAQQKQPKKKITKTKQETNTPSQVKNQAKKMTDKQLLKKIRDKYKQKSTNSADEQISKETPATRKVPDYLKNNDMYDQNYDRFSPLVEKSPVNMIGSEPGKKASSSKNSGTVIRCNEHLVFILCIFLSISQNFISFSQ